MCFVLGLYQNWKKPPKPPHFKSSVLFSKGNFSFCSEYCFGNDLSDFCYFVFPFFFRLVSGNSVEEKLLKNGTKDLIREVAAQGNDYSMAFLTQVS